MTNAEARLLRFVTAATAHARWVSDQTIRNTEDLLPGDEKAMPALLSRGLVERKTSETAYRVTDRGLKALGRGMGEL
jgi:RIO-like serine/threonine protein kinase